jgi:predicted nucleic acid-binding protein
MIDTNIIIRYLVGDGGDHAMRARNLFQSAADGKVILVILEIVFIEVVHVLRSYYKIEKSAIASALRCLIRLSGVETTTSITILTKGLENFETINASWPDALIAARSYVENIPEIYSFDEHFDKLKGIKKIVP